MQVGQVGGQHGAAPVRQTVSDECGNWQFKDSWTPPTRLSPSNNGPCAYGRLAHLRKGSVVGSITTFQGPTHTLSVSRMNPGPTLSFTDIGIIWRADHDADNLHLAELDFVAPGATEPRLLASFRNNTTGPNGSSVYRITLTRSDNGGQTWVFHSEVENNVPPYGLWEPFLFVAPDRSLHAYYAREVANNNQHIVMRQSRDGGLTWGSLVTVAGAGLSVRDGMPGVAAYHDGQRVSLLAIFESYGQNGCSIMSVKSVDNGTTWGQRSVVYTARGGRNAGAPQITRVGEHLAVVFMTNEDAPAVDWPKDAKVKAIASTAIGPNAITWTPAVTIANAPAYWPGILNHGQDRVFFTYNENALDGPLSALMAGKGPT